MDSKQVGKALGEIFCRSISDVEIGHAYISHPILVDRANLYAEVVKSYISQPQSTEILAAFDEALEWLGSDKERFSKGKKDAEERQQKGFAEENREKERPCNDLSDEKE